MFDLNPATAGEYLATTGHLGHAPLSVTELGGGVSNTVLLVSQQGRRFILKQPLDKLRVEQDWFCDRGRIYRECDALRYLNPLLPSGRVPSIVFEDRPNYVFAMTAAPASAKPWKTQLMRGECSPDAAATIGSTLAGMIRTTWKSREAERRFGDTAIFHQLRLDPYYLSTAARHPDLQPFYASLVQHSRERASSLVHGDFSPKNFLVDGAGVLAIDFEVVHYGDASFDAAFLLNHLLLKWFHLPPYRTALRDLADAFWAALSCGLPADAGWFEAATLEHLAGLLLARIDGKSPAEYIQQEDVKQEIRRFARELIFRPASSVRDVFHNRIR
ncbi:MAG TPA: phosphotransferase [Bryobacteraceae bacterium]|nr:phosphotransferase [Bryobacteraceae bacterium]